MDLKGVLDGTKGTKAAQKKRTKNRLLSRGKSLSGNLRGRGSSMGAGTSRSTSMSMSMSMSRDRDGGEGEIEGIEKGQGDEDEGEGEGENLKEKELFDCVYSLGVAVAKLSSLTKQISVVGYGGLSIEDVNESLTEAAELLVRAASQSLVSQENQNNQNNQQNMNIMNAIFDIDESGTGAGAFTAWKLDTTTALACTDCADSLLALLLWDYKELKSTVAEKTAQAKGKKARMRGKLGGKAKSESKSKPKKKDTQKQERKKQKTGNEDEDAQDKEEKLESEKESEKDTSENEHEKVVVEAGTEEEEEEEDIFDEEECRFIIRCVDHIEARREKLLSLLVSWMNMRITSTSTTRIRMRAITEGGDGVEVDEEGEEDEDVEDVEEAPFDPSDPPLAVVLQRFAFGMANDLRTLFPSNLTDLK